MPTALGTASWLVSWLLSFLWRCVASYTRRDTARRRLAVFMGFLYQIPLLNAMNIGSSSLLFYIPLVLNHKWLYNESNIISGKLKWMMHEQVNRLVIYNGVEWTKWYIICGYYSASSSHTLNSSHIAAPSVLCKMKTLYQLVLARAALGNFIQGLRVNGTCIWRNRGISVDSGKENNRLWHLDALLECTNVPICLRKLEDKSAGISWPRAQDNPFLGLAIWCGPNGGLCRKWRRAQ